MFTDPALDLFVVILPTLLSLLGVFVTLEPLDKKHKLKLRTALIVSGVLVSGLTCWQQARARARTAAEARSYHEQQIQQERSSEDKFNGLFDRFKSFVAQQKQKSVAAPQQTSAEEIASAVSKRLNDMRDEHQPAGITPPAKKTAPAVSSSAPSLPTVRPCRGDRLSECSDEQLLDWGQPLVSNVEAIDNGYMADLKKLDDIKVGNLNWLKEFVGVGDKDSKWLKSFAQAQEKAADHFKNCCAEGALAYHKELVQRVGGGHENAETYEWVQHLIKPLNSKEYKNAKQDADKIVNVAGDLKQLQIELHIAQINHQITSLNNAIAARHSIGDQRAPTP